MNEETLEKKGFIDFIKSKKKLLSILAGLLIFLLILLAWLEYNNENKKIKTSENFIQAKILYSNDKHNESLQILKKIIEERDRIYSPLSLFLIIDRNLEKDEKNILEYFDTVLSIGSLEKEDLNLIKFKKAIFISDSSNEQSVINLLNPIINSNSVWKIESLKFLGDYYFSLKEFRKAEQYYSILLGELDDNVDTSEIERKMKLIKND
tara:strand:+ start:1173 stop:1796 length:624 start_codon:yes stop_codon:yes gene_type:complete